MYLLALLGGLAAGLWPEAIYPSRTDVQAAPLGVLQTLSAAQVAFFLLVYPLVLFRRRQRPWRAADWKAAAAETGWLILLAAPFYLAGAYLADATAADAVRTALYVAAIATLSWTVAAVMARSAAARPWALLMTMMAALAMPAAYYIAREFLTPKPLNWLWRLTPMLFAWNNAASRIDSWIPEPLWAWFIWPLAAGIGACGLLLFKPACGGADTPAD